MELHTDVPLRVHFRPSWLSNTARGAPQGYSYLGASLEATTRTAVATGSTCISAPNMALARTPRVSRWVRASVASFHRDIMAWGPAHHNSTAASSRKSGTFKKNGSDTLSAGELLKKRTRFMPVRIVLRLADHGRSPVIIDIVSQLFAGNGTSQLSTGWRQAKHQTQGTGFIANSLSQFVILSRYLCGYLAVDE